MGKLALSEEATAAAEALLEPDVDERLWLAYQVLKRFAASWLTEEAHDEVADYQPPESGDW